MQLPISMEEAAKLDDIVGQLCSGPHALFQLFDRDSCSPFNAGTQERARPGTSTF
jgi:hypothetical protein